MPTLVTEGKDKDKLLSVNYTALIPVLTKAIQEQQKASEDQQKIIKKQDDQISIHQKEIAELKKMVELLLNKK